MTTRPQFLKDGLALLLAVIFAASMWFYFLRILIAYERADALAHDRPRGNLSDLYPRWLGSRELLLHHRNPYSPEMTREIQQGYYGRPLDASRPGDPRDQQGFAYPAYVAFLLAPTVSLPFDRVREGFSWFLAGLTVASVWMWLYAVRWKPACLMVAAITVLTLGSFPAVQGLRLQQLSLLVATLLAAAVLLLTRERLFLAGVVLAFVTIKPQLVAPLLLCLFLWMIAAWPTRRGLAWGFGGTMLALVGGAELLLPGWITSFRTAMRDYWQYTGGQSALDVLLSPTMGKPAAVLVVLMLVGIWWKFRRCGAQSSEFSLLVVLTLAATLIIIPTFASYNQVLLLPAVFLFIRERALLWQRDRWARIACLLVLLMIGWPWLAALGLSIASLALPAATVQQGWKIPLITTPAVPFACLLLLIPMAAEAWRRAAHAE
jgi:Glycosyltransferase family 87